MKVFLRAWTLTLLLAITSPLAAQGEETVYALRQAGWQLVEKTSHDEWLPGIAPYENLRRLIYVVTYTLQKQGETRICTLSRDNMRDTSTQSCRAAK